MISPGVQVYSFSFECMGCAKMKGLEVEMDRLGQIVFALVGREEVGCTIGSSGGTVDDKVGGGDERDTRESSPQPRSRLRGSKMTGRKETGCKKMGGKETGGTEMRGKATEVKESGAQGSQEGKVTC